MGWNSLTGWSGDQGWSKAAAVSASSNLVLSPNDISNTTYWTPNVWASVTSAQKLEGNPYSGLVSRNVSQSSGGRTAGTGTKWRVSYEAKAAGNAYVMAQFVVGGGFAGIYVQGKVDDGSSYEIDKYWGSRENITNGSITSLGLGWYAVTGDLEITATGFDPTSWYFNLLLTSSYTESRSDNGNVSGIGALFRNMSVIALP